MREEIDQPVNDFWLQLKKYGELDLDENKLVFCSSYNAPTFFEIYKRVLCIYLYMYHGCTVGCHE